MHRAKLGFHRIEGGTVLGGFSGIKHRHRSDKAILSAGTGCGLDVCHAPILNTRSATRQPTGLRFCNGFFTIRFQLSFWPTMRRMDLDQADVDAIVESVDLELLDRNLYRGHPVYWERGRLFGGLVASQALSAAYQTIEDIHVHSLHSYFLRPGDPEIPVIYDVDPIRDGRSFATRRVVARQRGEAIYNLSASFHKVEEGFEHQADMPAVAAPEDSPGPEDFGLSPRDYIPLFW